MSQCPSCKNEFVQPFVCATCGAEKLYDATLKTAQDQAALWEADLVAANARIAELEELVSEMTHNQRMQDSITAQVMERAEKAETVNASLREYCRLCDIEAAERKK